MVRALSSDVSWLDGAVIIVIVTLILFVILPWQTDFTECSYRVEEKRSREQCIEKERKCGARGRGWKAIKVLKDRRRLRFNKA